MKLYAAMVVGITIGVGIALVMAARDLESQAPLATTGATSAAPPTSPVVPPSTAAPGVDGTTTGA